MILDLFRHEVEFKNIQGYDDIKDVVTRALDAEDLGQELCKEYQVILRNGRHSYPMEENN
jgi:hypothetical protein